MELVQLFQSYTSAISKVMFDCCLLIEEYMKFHEKYTLYVYEYRTCGVFFAFKNNASKFSISGFRFFDKYLDVIAYQKLKSW